MEGGRAAAAQGEAGQTADVRFGGDASPVVGPSVAVASVASSVMRRAVAMMLGPGTQPRSTILELDGGRRIRSAGNRNVVASMTTAG
eukprot:1668013-Pyramimonas_sp.AAC.1